MEGKMIAIMAALRVAMTVAAGAGLFGRDSGVFDGNQPLLEQYNTQYLDNSVCSSNVLQEWYNITTGLYNTAGWWQSANCIQVLADLTVIHPSFREKTGCIFSNTFSNAQNVKLKQIKYNTTESCFWDGCPDTTPVVVPKGFWNDYYDDEGWWALAWLKVYDIWGQDNYLRTAQGLFEDMLSTGYNATCGGIWWDRQRTYHAAIANELFLSLAAQLANRVPNLRSYYLDWATKQWDFFQKSGLINANGTINDGLDGKTCKNNNGTVYTYNQGVILGGLAELARAHPVAATEYIDAAIKIASAAIAALTDKDGVLHEPREDQLAGDGLQFKGIFLRNVQAILAVLPPRGETARAYLRFVLVNADSVWAHARDPETGRLGPVWSGPYVPAMASSHSSAMDALIAAAAYAAFLER